MADTQHAPPAEMQGASFSDGEPSIEQISAYRSAEDPESANSERIFNLTGTSKLSMEHIARLSGEQGDQLGAGSASDTGSGQSSHVSLTLETRYIRSSSGICTWQLQWKPLGS